MVDRELLELAAKAAGIPIKPDFAECFDYYMADPLMWNPLQDDGDALRLAMAIGASVYADGLIVVDSDKHYVVDHFDDGIIESLRHAIVRVAAEIGRNTAKGDGGGV